MGLTSLTVFVVADDDQGIRLRETFVRWSGERLVAQSAWVTPSSTMIPDFGPPVVLAQIVEDGTSREEDLFRFIGKYRLDVVRVVLGQLIVGNDAPSTHRCTRRPQRSWMPSIVRCRSLRERTAIPRSSGGSMWSSR